MNLMTNPTITSTNPLQGDMENCRVQASALSKRYSVGGDVVHALNDVGISIRQGEMVVLLGPSGCGKTTLLRTIAGLEQPQKGRVSIGGKLVYSAENSLWVPPEKRNVSMVFQSYALWPHMTVRQNVAYPLDCRGWKKEDVRKRVSDVIDAVGLDGKADRKPSQLSGGQQQRVALARAIAANTQVVLFDEPLSNVDAKVRDQIRREIINLQRELGFAGLYVTHDQVEAGAIADTLVIMDHGRVAQVGAPIEVYDQPQTRYVANFMGPSNESAGVIHSAEIDGLFKVRTAWGEILGRPCGKTTGTANDVDVLFRPEACAVSTAPVNAPNSWQCSIQRRIFMGTYVELVLETLVEGKPVTLSASVGKHEMIDQTTVWANVPANAMWIFAR